MTKKKKYVKVGERLIKQKEQSFHFFIKDIKKEIKTNNLEAELEKEIENQLN